MKQIITILLLSISYFTFGQIDSLKHFCSIDNSTQPAIVYPVQPSRKAQLIIDTLLKHIPVSENTLDFYATDVNKACAVIVDGRRVVYFDERYLRGIERSQKTRWAIYFVLAHEIAHHLNGDPLDESKNRPITELEADCQAAKVLAQMGATKDETIAVIDLFKNEDTKTHPRSSARKVKAENCWFDASEKVKDIYAPYKMSNCRSNRGELKVHNGTGGKLLIKAYISGNDPNSKRALQSWGKRTKDFYIGPASKRTMPLPPGSFEITIHRVSSYGYEQIPIQTESITIEKCTGYPIFIER